MRRTVAGVVTAGVLLAALPTPAFADSGAPGADPVSLGVSLLGLIVAAILLLETIGVRKVAMGGAIADKISYVILATVCLAASAIAQWARNFLAGLTAEQLQMASQVLVIVAMALLAAYFYSVRKTLQGYLTAMTGQELLEQERLDD